MTNMQAQVISASTEYIFPFLILDARVYQCGDVLAVAFPALNSCVPNPFVAARGWQHNEYRELGHRSVCGLNPWIKNCWLRWLRLAKRSSNPRVTYCCMFRYHIHPGFSFSWNIRNYESKFIMLIPLAI